MHSAALDGNGSPRKRAFSRGLSEDESLRSIIETESSSRRLTRSESRTGTLKRTTDSQSDQDLLMGLPEMLELQASYDEVVQELRGLEVERETLLFQVDVLQDTLESAEELLAEAQREAGQASMELELEREARKKQESLVSSLRREVERLKEEMSNKPPASGNVTDEVTSAQLINHVGSEVIKGAGREEKDSTLCEAHSSIKASEEQEVSEAPDEQSLLTKLRRMVSPPLSQSLALDNLVSIDGVHQRPYKNHTEDGRDLSPDRDDSAYEDASAETPEQEMLPGDGDLPLDSENKENGSAPGETQELRNPEVCVLS
ncbi:leucine-rich repeat flightless-interacting protein 1 [Nematolebias whitei]|uniref:leucine-rich repeat flightless-interacting protein 1 n=1 Tax=Nematolebias whitei TaxID=451745 RepID=UPI00189A50D7|nr:leucine-rich repeat flightless-interacting protein 1 [Nematolebias whitei]